MSIVANGVTPHAEYLGHRDDPPCWWRRPKQIRRRKKKPGPQPKGQRGRKAILHTVPLTFCAYALTIVWYCQHGQPAQDVQRVKKQRAWYRQKAEPSFADMLSAVRRSFRTARILCYPSLKQVRHNITRLLDSLAIAA